MNQKNIGRINNRLLLAEKSQYEWLIFLDVDTLPNEDNFLKNYIEQLNRGTNYWWLHIQKTRE